MSTLFENLIAQYKTASIPFQELKAITLAQWILESGRGTSQLAIQHLNFAGLKWRSEMVGYATPVEYEANDGLDFYCKFSSLDAFIVGYWKFLSRSPYDGWEEKAADGPEAFLRFIGPIYNPAGDIYVESVLSLLPEAKQRLGAAPATPAPPLPPPVPGTPVVIVIDPGHGGTVEVGGSSPNNANSPSGEKEKTWTLDIAKRTRAAVLAAVLTQGKNVDVVLTRETDINKGLSARANVAKSKKAKLFLSIHFNGFVEKPGKPQVRGVETLVHPINVNLAQDKAFAQTIQNHVLGAMHKIDPATQTMAKYDRKVKEQKLGVLKDIELGNTGASHPCRACLVEIEFMDTPAVEALLRLNPPQASSAAKTAKNRQIIADALAQALLVHV